MYCTWELFFETHTHTGNAGSLSVIDDNEFHWLKYQQYVRFHQVPCTVSTFQPQDVLRQCCTPSRHAERKPSGSAMAEGPRDALSVEILQLQNIPFEN